VSFDVLVIFEHHANDRYVGVPIIGKVLQAHGRKAVVRACIERRPNGVADALSWTVIEPILRKYAMVDLFVLLVDRDGQAGRRQRLTELEQRAAAVLGQHQHLIAESAWQELEVWVLAGCRDFTATWKDVRAEVHAKETYFEPYAKQRGVADGPGGGRQQLGREAAAHYDRVRQLCPQDVGRLHERLA
jgi:hypothetical protein